MSVDPSAFNELLENVGGLKAKVQTHDEAIRDISHTLSAISQVNAETTVIVNRLTTAVEKQHTPETCVMRGKVDKLWLYVMIVGGIGSVLLLLKTFGLLDDVGRILQHAGGN